MKAYLILENGVVMQGCGFGAQGAAVGEVVFATGMTGYIETLTDRSYHGQIVLQTFPLIGNYGVISNDFESGETGPLAYIVKHPCETPSNFRSEKTLDAFLKERGVIGLYGIDTRELTRMIRQNGVLNGKITQNEPTEADLNDARLYRVSNPIAEVSVKEPAQINGERGLVVLMDFGAKRGIAEALCARALSVRTVPYNTSARDILSQKPDGIMLSNGPGDPSDPANSAIIDTIRALGQSGVPIFGICLGHQLLALSRGYKTKKLKFGHRGANQPVKDTATGRVYITSQNHGYAVVADNSSFININDLTCEGLDYGDSFSVQFHPEAKGGPLDTAFLFDKFLERIEIYGAR